MTHLRFFLLVSLLLAFCQPAHSQNTIKEGTQAVSERYLELDSGLRYDDLGDLYSETTSFYDPTSKVFGPQSGRLFENAEQLLARRHQMYQNITEFDFLVEDRFTANHHSVYMGTVTYTIASGLSFAQPAVFVIEVREGKVTRHWDFVDYSVVPN